MKKKKDGGKGQRLGERICGALDIPPDLLPHATYLEIRGRSALTVSGARRILLYTPEEIRLDLRDCTLSVRGSGLLCTSYHVGAVGIDGRIASVSFEDGED